MGWRMANMSKPEFDRALLAFALQIEMAIGLFNKMSFDSREDGVAFPHPFVKELRAIEKNARGIRKEILLQADYLTDEQRATLLDSSFLDELLKRGDSL